MSTVWLVIQLVKFLCYEEIKGYFSIATYDEIKLNYLVNFV